MDTASHFEVTSAPSVSEMMRAVFGETPSLAVLDVQPAIRALNAKLRGRSTIAAHRAAARYAGQANIQAHHIRFRNYIAGTARQLLPRTWWPACCREIGFTGGLVGKELVRPPAMSTRLDAITIDVLIDVADSAAQGALELDRHHGVQYVHHFPTHDAQIRAAAALKAA